MEKTERGDRRGEGEGLTIVSNPKIDDLEYCKMVFKNYKKSLENVKTVQPVNYLFFSHVIIGGIVPLSATCIGGFSIIPYLGFISAINLLIGFFLNGKNVILSKIRLLWVLGYFIGPHILGQPVSSIAAFSKSANLAFFYISTCSAYSKYDAINTITTLLSLSASLFLVLDWMRWWQDYPLPIINAIALGHMITATYIICI